MKTRSILVCLVTALMVFSSVTTLAAGSSGKHVLGAFRVKAMGDVVIQSVDGAWENPDGCEGAAFLILTANSTAFSEKYAVLLGARFSMEPVVLWVDGCATYSGVTYPKIASVTLP